MFWSKTSDYPIEGFEVYRMASANPSDFISYLYLTDPSHHPEVNSPASCVGSFKLRRNAIFNSGSDTHRTYLDVNLRHQSRDAELQAALGRIASAFRHEFDTQQIPEHQRPELYGLWVELDNRPKSEKPVGDVDLITLEFGNLRPHTVGVRHLGTLLEEFGATEQVRDQAWPIAEMYISLAKAQPIATPSH